MARSLLIAAASASCLLLSACGKKEEAPPPPAPGAHDSGCRWRPGEASTYTAEIRSRYETDLSFQVGGKS